MSFLYLLENLRTPWLDKFFLAVTSLGEETIFIIIGLLFFWCINKYEGYYILSVGFIGTVINQFLKIACRIPRPWVKDPHFTIVEEAREAAGGYSFPSGHTQSSVGVFGSVARWHKNRIVRTVCIILCVLIPFSRMYLGVHTPADVLVSVGVALILIFLVRPVITNAETKPRVMWALIAVMLLLSLSLLLFVNLYNFPADIDMHNYESALKNGYTLTGCVLGLAVVYFFDSKYIHFKTDAVWWAQLLKLIGGAALVFGIKAGLKVPLNTLIGHEGIARLLRYFIMVAVAGAVWPLTFKRFERLGKKQN